jgi:hypothetical protein
VRHKLDLGAVVAVCWNCDVTLGLLNYASPDVAACWLYGVGMPDATGSFKTHAQYLRALAHLAGYSSASDSTDQALERLAQRVVALRIFGQLQGRADADWGEVRTRLSNAWGTELLLALSGVYAVEDELVRVSNSWGVVQAYYVTYHAAQALMVASGQRRPTSHPPTQRFFMSWWTERELALAPWSVAAHADGYANLPAGRVIDESIHPWVRCDDDSCWDIAAKALRTTREDAIPEKLRDTRENKRKATKRAWEEEESARVGAGRRPRVRPTFRLPRLTADEREAATRRVRAHTFMDYLWRLRVKANYEDVAVFTEGPEDAHASAHVQRDLGNLAAGTLLVHELCLRQLIGRARLLALADEWLGSTMPPQLNVGLRQRRELLEV